MFSSSRAVSLSRWTVFCLVFWGIPVFLISFFFGQISREKESSRRAELEDRLEKTLGGGFTLAELGLKKK